MWVSFENTFSLSDIFVLLVSLRMQFIFVYDSLRYIGWHAVYRNPRHFAFRNFILKRFSPVKIVYLTAVIENLSGTHYSGKYYMTVTCILCELLHFISTHLFWGVTLYMVRLSSLFDVFAVFSDTTIHICICRIFTKILITKHGHCVQIYVVTVK